MVDGIYQDDTIVECLTERVLAEGVRLFQVHWLAENEEEHVGRLLEFFNPALGARVLDVGCGVGGLALAMARRRPDIKWTLLNVSVSQLRRCPIGMERVHAAAEDIPLPDGSQEAVLMSYVLGHVEVERAFQEAARVMKPGGVLFVYDMLAEEPSLLRMHLLYDAVPWSVLMWAAAAADLRLDVALSPMVTSTAVFCRFATWKQRLAAGTATPIIARFLRC